MLKGEIVRMEWGFEGEWNRVWSGSMLLGVKSLELIRGLKWIRNA